MTINEKQALPSLRELILHVFNSQGTKLTGITYQELAKRIGRVNKHGDGHGHGMGNVLGIMGHHLLDLEGEWKEQIPHIQSLVVNKSGSLEGLPDVGIEEFWPEYTKLSKQEKQLKVLLEYQRIEEFDSRWNKVLKDLGLPVVTPESSGLEKTYKGGGSGESLQHKDLKEYVKDNPHLVGANSSCECIIEYPLPSLDSIDVVFKSSNCWIAVEVKSAVSDFQEQDYERGIYQCIKYQAQLEAMKLDGHYIVPENIRTVLVLENSLPEKYRHTAKILKVSVFENFYNIKDSYYN